jgi:uncharacterized protein YbbK (DUF523 family)
VEKVLVSACLLGANVRYHGGHARLLHPVLQQWMDEGRLVPACPEVAGGLSTPRPPAEVRWVSGDRSPSHALVTTNEGEDVSDAFARGAEEALELARRFQIRVAVLKDGSPSCGSTTIHDGTFTGTTVNGEGVTAALLRASGVHVFSEQEIGRAHACLQALEKRALTPD